MFRKLITLFSMIALLLAGCGAAAPQLNAIDRAAVQKEEIAVAPAAGGAPSANQPAASVERLVIKNASIAILVDDPALSAEAISQMADELGGFVVSSNIYQTTAANGVRAPQATVTIRVPAEKLNECLQRIKTETSQPVISENVASEDVTAAYTDLQSRLRNAEAAEEELRTFLDTAQKTDDVLSVYTQLKIVREEIEIIKGQIQYYEQSASLSSISVELRANAAEQPISVGGWQPVGVAKEALEALIAALQGLSNLAIWFVIFCLPLLLIAGIPLTLIAVFIRSQARKIKKQAPASPARSPEPQGGDSPTQ